MVLLVLLILLWANLNSMIVENCTNRIISEIPSPDGKNKAVIFQRKCGIDSIPSTQVMLLPVSETLQNRKGNLFAVEGNARRVAVNLIWKSPGTIELTHKSHQSPLRRVNSLMGVSVSYPKPALPMKTPKK